ncbi:hypothetical protein NCZ32_15300, partial [Bacteroides faecis]|nr:hypothetical protein [Bacteroides faecis]
AITKNFMPKDIKTLGNNKARACESLGFVHKKRLCQRFDTTSLQRRKQPGTPHVSTRLPGMYVHRY